jgi:putative chitinase
MITDALLKAIMPASLAGNRLMALGPLNTAARRYQISNKKRLAAWLATLAVESGQLRYQEEIASGEAYEGRVDLGNNQPGDGRRFKGHGRIQITGRYNHGEYTEYLKGSGHLPVVDFLREPKRLGQEPYATDSSGWFFAEKIKANPHADAGNFLGIQVRVNGRNRKTGLPNHWQERLEFYNRALKVIPDDWGISDEQA